MPHATNISRFSVRSEFSSPKISKRAVPFNFEFISGMLSSRLSFAAVCTRIGKKKFRTGWRKFLQLVLYPLPPPFPFSSNSQPGAKPSRVGFSPRYWASSWWRIDFVACRACYPWSVCLWLILERQQGPKEIACCTSDMFQVLLC